MHISSQPDKSSVLLIIDMQNDLCFNNPIRKKKVIDAIPLIIDTIQLFKSKNLPVIFACFELKHNDPIFYHDGDQYCIENTFGAEIIDELKPFADIIIKKKHNIPFVNTSLDRILLDYKCKNIYLIGLQTHKCIFATARTIFTSYNHYQAFVIQDCVISTTEEKKYWSLERIKQKGYATIVSLNDTDINSNISIQPFNPDNSLKHSRIEEIKLDQLMPRDLSTEGIDLEIGSGGNSSNNFINDEIIKRFANKYLNELEDGATLNNLINPVFTSDSLTIKPVIFPGGDIGKLAVSSVINDLTAMGAKARYLSFNLVINEGFPVEKLELILNSMEKEVKNSGAFIVTGDTKTLPKESLDDLIISMSGIGELVNAPNSYALKNTIKGDQIIITGNVGTHGFSIHSVREEGIFGDVLITSDCASLDLLILPLLTKYDIHSLRDPTRGGLSTALVDLAEATNLEVRINSKTIPILEEVKEAWLISGWYPLDETNEGIMLITVADKDARQLLKELKAHPLGKNSRIIGEVRKGENGKAILEKEQVQILLKRPNTNFLPRSC